MALEAYLTTAGLNVLTKLMASRGPLKFIKAELGDGKCSGEEACRARTSLVKKVAEATFVGARYEGGEAKITTQYENEGLDTGFFVNEIGLYVQDPDSASAVLYCYATFGDNPDWIAPESSARYVRTYDIITIVSNVASVEVNVSPSAMVDQEEFDERLAEVGGAILALESYVMTRLGHNTTNLDKLQGVDITGAEANMLAGVQFALKEHTASIDGALLALATILDQKVRGLEDELTKVNAALAELQAE